MSRNLYRSSVRPNCDTLNEHHEYGEIIMNLIECDEKIGNILVQSTKHTEVYEHAFVSKKERTSKIDEIKTRLSSDYRL